MKFFTCLLNSHAPPFHDQLRDAYEAVPCALGLKFNWQSVGRSLVLTAWDDPHGDPVLASHREWGAVGSVRLDNRAEVASWAGCDDRDLSDLCLVLRLVERHGERYVGQILGDFAFVLWNGAAQTALAACDAFAVRKLYYAARGGLFAFSSRAEALALGDCYEVQYLAEAVAMCLQSPQLTVYAGVHQLSPGTLAVIDRGRLTTRTYWSPDEFEPAAGSTCTGHEAAEVCRELLAESVRLRLSGNVHTWAHLSGGLDSSSIVSLARWLGEQGAAAGDLDGTVTYVDRVGTESDERTYSDAVVKRWGLRNETIVNPPFWLDEHSAPPHLDQPRDSLPFYPRERRLCAIVRSAGGRVLLAGFGGDELFTGSMFFFADWLARGHVRHAIREMAHRAVIGRVSFWELAHRNALLPLLPRLLRHPLLRDQGRLLPWIQPATVRRYGLRDRVSVALAYAGPMGRKYQHTMATSVTALSRSLDPGLLGDALEVRYPFLYRPLVEFALRLQPEMCTRPQARKWVLREAMRGILPEIVRARVGKGAASALLSQSLGAQRTLLEPLVRQPILADLDVIDATKLRQAFDEAPRRAHRRDELHNAVQLTLVIEAWLQMRSGRWPPGTTQIPHSQQSRLTKPRSEITQGRNV